MTRHTGLLTGLTMVLALAMAGSRGPLAGQGRAAEALTGVDGRTNGFVSQAEFESARELFEERDDVAKGLGPVYNAQSCAECHQTPVTGAGSQVTVLRAGHFDGANFVDHPGGSLIQDRAIVPSLQEHVLPGYEVRAMRISLSALGDGYIEAIDDRTLLDLSRNEPAAMRGDAVQVPVLEAPGTTRVGRFGWKAQHASLLSFSADAYLNEIGITSRLLQAENTSNGMPVAFADAVPDGAPGAEDVDNDIDGFATFMRATKAPPRDETLARSPDALTGESQFRAIGCASCHVADITTAPAGTVINGGTFVVPAALGGKTIHPYSDFLVHDVGTGDGIVQNGGPSTRNKLRTPPLWGLRMRSRLMHDGLSVTTHDAVMRHAGEARDVVRFYGNLSPEQQRQILAFLSSL